MCLYLVGVVEGVIHEAGDKRSLANYLKINVEKEQYRCAYACESQVGTCKKRVKSNECRELVVGRSEGIEQKKDD